MRIVWRASLRTVTEPALVATSDQIATAFLQALGAPTTPAMRKAVSVWLAHESGSANQVVGGNPWNITKDAAQEVQRSGGPAPIGYRTLGTHQFALYPSSTVGAAAAARLLIAGGNDWRGYGHIVTAARTGNPTGFLTALASSAWDEGRYGTKNGGANRLLQTYNGTTGQTPGTVGSNAGTVNAAAAEWLASKGYDPSRPVTQADWSAFVTWYTKRQGQDPGGEVQSALTKAGASHIGQPWSAYTSVDPRTDYAPPGVDWLGAIGGVFTSLADPGHWVFFLALIAGSAIAGYGAVHVLSSGTGINVPRPRLPV